jgi:hypothetical protein
MLPDYECNSEILQKNFRENCTSSCRVPLFSSGTYPLVNLREKITSRHSKAKFYLHDRAMAVSRPMTVEASEPGCARDARNYATWRTHALVLTVSAGPHQVRAGAG